MNLLPKETTPGKSSTWSKADEGAEGIIMHDIGRESRNEYSERYAGHILTRQGVDPERQHWRRR